MKKRRDVGSAAPAPEALSSLGDVLRSGGVHVGRDQPAPRLPPPSAVTTGEPELSRTGKLIVRRERKGHGGKTVTVVEGLRLPAPRLETFVRTMRQALGRGGWIVDGRVMLQGDRAAAAEAWLRGRGATQVTRGN